MCSRFELVATPKEINFRFGLSVSGNMPDKGERRPTDPALVFTSQGPRLMNWGLTVNWSTKPLINTRCETLKQKKTFSSLLKARCLIPASAYFEWRKNGQTKSKNRITSFDRSTPGPLFTFAGLTDGENFTIITCPTAQSISHINNRMPVIIESESEGLWINLENSFETVSKILVPYRKSKLKAVEAIPAPNPQSDLFKP
jgi:putative SOS response-associated peptidase YedK